MGCLMGERSLPKPLQGRGCVPPKYFFLSKRASLSCEKGVSLHWREPFFTPTKRPLYLQTMVFTPLSITSLRSVTAGSERGRGCSWVGGEAFSWVKKGVSFCVFPCSFRNSVSLSGSVPFVYSVLKIPQQRTYWCFSTTEVITFLNCELCTLNQRRALGGTHPLPWRGLGRLSFICKRNCFTYNLCLFNKNGGGK